MLLTAGFGGFSQQSALMLDSLAEEEFIMPLKIIALDSALVDNLRSGAADANGQPAEHSVSDGAGNPCRHCLAEIEGGAPMLILAHRPFTTLQPYAELGPIFVCADKCQRHGQHDGIPPLYRSREMLMRGYDHDERIVYGTGKVIDMRDAETEAHDLFTRAEVAFIHLRSPSNNCYHFRLERA